MSAARAASGAAAAAAAYQAVTAMYGEQYRPLVRLAALLTGDQGTAERVVQDCFVALHRAWRQAWDDQAALAWLRHGVVSRSRAARNRCAPALSAMPPALAGAIAALPGRQREALVLRFYAGLPDPEIAAAMGVSMPAARRHAASAAAAVRDVL
jgi:DNA-directed RNA polymerase specialized sigma24 family protein